jgi:hypothetical protein
MGEEKKPNSNISSIETQLANNKGIVIYHHDNLGDQILFKAFQDKDVKNKVNIFAYVDNSLVNDYLLCTEGLPTEISSHIVPSSVGVHRIASIFPRDKMGVGVYIKLDEGVKRENKTTELKEYLSYTLVSPAHFKKSNTRG